MSSRALTSDNPDRNTPSLPSGKVTSLVNAFSRNRSTQGKSDCSVKEITLETSIESTSVHRAWSATPSREHLTRSSTGGDSIPLQEMWKDPGQSRWDDRL
jgi:hypothetical protein